MFLYFIQGATLGLSATATPGPFQAFLLSQTLQNGWRRTLPASLAPLISDGPIIFFVLLVLTQAPAWSLNGLQAAGGLFLLYLAWVAYQSLNAAISRSPADPQISRHKTFLKAVLMNGLSPGPYIFWGVLAGPIVVEAWRQSPGLGMSFVLGFYGTLIGGFALFIMLFATASRFGPGVNYILRIISVIALLMFGVYQLWTGLSAIVTF